MPHRPARNVNSSASTKSSTARRLRIEPLEDRSLLAALVGVDFDVTFNSFAPVPGGWNLADFDSANGGTSTHTFSNLQDEAGGPTPFDLQVVLGAPPANFGALDFLSGEAIAVATLPSRSGPGEPTLENLGGFVFVDNSGQTISATFSDLLPGAIYELYVFGLEGDGGSSSQSVSINGAAPFSQNPNTSGSNSNLWINGQQGTGAPLESFAVTANANALGEIAIVVTANGNSAAVGGLAIREVGLVVNSTSDVDDMDAGNGSTTLREAIRLTNNNPGANTITFDATVFATPQTIALASQLPTITDDLTITGPGQTLLTLDAGNGTDNTFNTGDGFRIFSIDDGNNSQLIDVALRGLRLTGGDISDRGGAIRNLENLTVAASTITGNAVFGSGSSRSGGGIYHGYGSLDVTESTLSGNVSKYGGGIANFDIANVTASTLSGNTASVGGGIFNAHAANVTASTLSGNSAIAEGGGIFNNGTANITASTLSGNSAFKGGGISNAGVNSIAYVNNTIVAGSVSGGDIAADDVLTFNGFRNLIEDGQNTNGLSITITGNPLLGPLADNGGPTQTHALLPGSPALDAGDPAISSGNDQRGAPFVRVFDDPEDTGNGVDIGAYERQTLAPSLFVVNTTSDEFDYSNAEVSLREAIGFANGSAGADTITFDPAVFTGGAASLIRLSGTELAITDSVTIDGSAATDVVITADAAGDDTLVAGTFITDVAASLVGSDRLDDNSRVLNFSSFAGDLTLEGLTITGGRTTGRNQEGGGIRFNSDGALTLTSSTLSGNSTAGNFAFGGAISTYSGSVMLTSSTLSGNSTAGSYAYGGAISTYSGSVTLTSSTVSGNSTAGSGADGGGIRTLSVAVTLTGSTVTGNRTAGNYADGGGIFTYSGAVTLTSSTVTGNRAAQGAGGGVFVLNSSGNPNFTIQNSIVAGNTENGNAPDLRPDPDSTLTISHSLIGVADNLGTITGNVGNQTGTAAMPLDPRLGPLADNGGPTQTHAILPGSPALDAGDPTFSPQNIALTGTATQSSEFQFAPFPASNAIDGDYQNFTHTNDNDNMASWQVDLGSTQPIGRIVLHNRSDALEVLARFRDITVQVLDAVGNVLFTSPLLNPENVLGGGMFGAGPATLEVDLVALTGGAVGGRKIKVSRTADPDLSGQGGVMNVPAADMNTLSLAEVEVFAGDQRGLSRVVDGGAGGGVDIGAYESQGVPSFPNGDYNHDGVASLADYTVWRDTLGATGVELAADGTGDDLLGVPDGDVDAFDYQFWKANFGNTTVPVTPAPAPITAAFEQPAAEAAFAQWFTPPATAPTSEGPTPVPTLPVQPGNDSDLLLLALNQTKSATGEWDWAIDWYTDQEQTEAEGEELANLAVAFGEF